MACRMLDCDGLHLKISYSGSLKIKVSPLKISYEEHNVRNTVTGRAGIKIYIYIYMRSQRRKVKTFFSFSFFSQTKKTMRRKAFGHSLYHFQTRGSRGVGSLKKARSRLGISRDVVLTRVRTRVKMIERVEVEWAEMRMGGDKAIRDIS